MITYYRYTFNEGFAEEALASNLTMTLTGSEYSTLAGYGNAPPSLSVYSTVLVGSYNESFTETTGGIWEDFGIPINSRILQVRVKSYDIRQEYINGSLLTFKIHLKSNGTRVVSNLINDSDLATNTAWVKKETGSFAFIPTANKESSSQIELEIEVLSSGLSNLSQFYISNIVLEIYSIQEYRQMPGIATQQRGWSLGVETTAGTVVTPTALLPSISVMFSPTKANNIVKRAGIKSGTGVTRGWDGSTGSLGGVPTFDAIPYLNSAFLKTTTPTQPARNGIHVITVSAVAALGGTFTLTYSGQTTSALAFGASAATVKAALELLSTIGTGNVLVTLTSQVALSSVWTITLVGALRLSTTAMTGSGASLTGTSATLAVGTYAASSATYDWVFQPAYQGQDTIKTYTIEEGVPGVASLGSRIPFVVLSSMGIHLDTQNTSISGSVFGQALTEGITATTITATSWNPVKPLDFGNVKMWIGDSLISVASGLRQITELISVERNFQNRWKPKLTLNADNSYTHGDIVEEVATWDFSFTVENNATDALLLAKLRAGTKQFIVVECTGLAVEGTTSLNQYNYTYQLMACIQIKTSSRGDNDGVYTATFPCEAILDATEGYFVKESIRCALVSL